MGTCYSRYSHTIKKENKYAIINSLYLKPIYLDNDEYEMLRPYLVENNTKIPEPYYSAFRKYHIIVEESDDQNILDKLKKVKDPEAYIAFFIVSEECNLRCKYCFIDDCYKKSETKRMSIETSDKCLDYYSNIIRENKQNNENFIMIYGGEPFTNKETTLHLVSRIDEMKRNKTLPENLQVNITTNGTLLDETTIEVLKTKKVTITISLDGDKRCNSDRIYVDGKETFEDVVKSCKLIKKHGMKLFLSITLTEKSLDSFDEIMAMIEELEVDGLGFNPIIPRKQLLSSEYPEKVGQFLTEAFQYLRKKKIWDARVMPKIKAFSESRIYLYDCAVTSGSQITFLPSGRIATCHALVDRPEYDLCTINDNFETAKSKLKKWTLRNPIHCDSCLDCIALGLCGGTCPVISIDNGDNVDKMDEKTCIYNRMIMEWIIWDTFDKNSVYIK